MKSKISCPACGEPFDAATRTKTLVLSHPSRTRVLNLAVCRRCANEYELYLAQRPKKSRRTASLLVLLALLIAILWMVLGGGWIFLTSNLG